MTTSEKVAYLKGLVEGYGIDTDTKEGKLLLTVVDILEDLAFDVEELDDSIDSIAENVSEMEDIMLGDTDDDFDDEFDDELDDDELDELLEDVVLYEAKCPACGESVTFDEGVLAQGGIECPACGENLEFDLDDGEDEPED